jgi:hypothetical protein
MRTIAGQPIIFSRKTKFMSRPQASDYLRPLFANPLERKGITFVPQLVTRNGAACVAVVFQNRYTGDAKLRLVLSGAGKPPFPKIKMEFTCLGSAFGVHFFPVAVPPEFLGKTATFAVQADTRYSNGRGDQIRPDAGASVAKARSDGAEAAILLLFFFVDILSLFSATKKAPTLPPDRCVSITFPASAPAVLGSVNQPETLVLAMPGDDPASVAEHLRALFPAAPAA